MSLGKFCEFPLGQFVESRNAYVPCFCNTYDSWDSTIHMYQKNMVRMNRVDIWDLYGTRGFLDSQIRGFVDSWIRGFVDSWTRGFVDSWIRGFVDSRICGLVGSWIRGFVDSSNASLLCFTPPMKPARHTQEGKVVHTSTSDMGKTQTWNHSQQNRRKTHRFGQLHTHHDFC